jgi:hypothetical protein
LFFPKNIRLRNVCVSDFWIFEMGKACIIYGCKNRESGNGEGDKIKFHRIPKEEPRRSLWLRALNKRDENTGKAWFPIDVGARVCSKHFIKGMYLIILILLFIIKLEKPSQTRQTAVQNKVSHFNCRNFDDTATPVINDCNITNFHVVF